MSNTYIVMGEETLVIRSLNKLKIKLIQSLYRSGQALSLPGS
jgi:hypothetical protein